MIGLLLALLPTQILLLHGRQHTALAATGFKGAFKLVALCWVLRRDGGVFSVAKTLV